MLCTQTEIHRQRECIVAEIDKIQTELNTDAYSTIETAIDKIHKA